LQVTIYLTEHDEYIVRLLDDRSRRERKSRSAVILSILEEHFEKDKRLGEILVDLGVVSPKELDRVLQLQRDSFSEQLLGELLVSEQGIDEMDVQRALEIQSRFRLPSEVV